MSDGGQDLEFHNAASAGGVCRAHLFGPFRLNGADGRQIVIQGRRTRAILAYLRLSPKQDVGRERLAGLFWADRAESQARASLRQCLLELRTAVAKDGEELIAATRDSVSLARNAFACDIADLREALASEDCHRAAELVNAAGTARLLEDLDLSGPFSEWLDTTRAEIDAEIADRLQHHVERCEAQADWPAVKTLTNAWLRRDPLSEHAMAALIRAELATGSRAAAHIRYKAFRAQLAAEIGVEPGPMVEAAMRGEASLPPAPAAQEPVRQPEPDQRREPDPAPGPVADPQKPVLAVLAFDNLSSDSDLGWFCDGVSEEIQRTVARLTDVKVVARSSSFQFRGAEKAVANVCTALGTTHVLDGSVRRSGERVRISAELVEHRGHRTVWAERVDGDLDDVFALQDTIAEKVVRALQLKLLPHVPTVPLEPAAYEQFFRARELFAGGDPQYDDTAERAVPLLEAVTAQAPDHAPAWELLAIARAWVLRSGRSDQPFAEARAAVVDAAETALRLDQRRGGAYSALALLEPWGAYAARERLLQRALEVGPRDPVALTDMSTFCWSVGRFNDALGYAEQACELNPMMPSARLTVAQMRAYVGDYEASIQMHREMRKRWPDNPGVLYSLINSAPILGFWDDYDDVVGEIDRFDGWIGADMRATRTYAETLRSMEPEKIERRVQRYADLIDRTGTLPLNLVVSIGALGLADRALDLAERASYEFIFDIDGPRPSHFGGTVLARWSQVIAQPRFVNLCARLGLTDYWVETGKWPDCVAWAPYDFRAEVRRAARTGRNAA